MGKPVAPSLGLAKRRLVQARNARAPYEPDWFLNLAFFEGEQWLAWDGRGLFRPRLRARVTITDNRTRPIIRTEVAKLTKARPEWDAIPTGLDDQSVSDAQSAGRLIDWNWDEFGMAENRRAAIEWSRVVCAGFIKTTWDRNAGKWTDYLVDEQGKAIRGPKGPPLRVGDEVPAGTKAAAVKRVGGGEVRHEVRSPFNIFPDPHATSLATCRWLIDESVRSVEDIQEMFGGKPLEPDAAPQVDIVQSRMGGGDRPLKDGSMSGVRVYEMWERPSRLCPTGRHVVWHDGGLLFDGPNDYGELPYTMFPGIPVPGRFWPDSVLTDLRPLQAARNKLLSQIFENLARLGNPMLLLDRMSNIKVTGVPGEQIRHSATLDVQLPKYLNPPGMPAETFQLLDRLESAMQEIAGQYEAQQGGVPNGVTAASAISLIQEQDATRLGPDVEALELAIGRWGQQTLTLQAKFYTDERILVLLGEDGVIDVSTFRASADFKAPRVRVVTGSTFPRSVAAKQAAIRDTLNMLLQYGVPIPAPSMAKALRDMQVGGLERLVGGYTADLIQATREHVEFQRGKELEVHEWDDHPTHISAHDDYMKSARFLAMTPEEQKPLIDHARLHRDALKEAEAEALAAQQPTPGAPIVGQPQLPPGTVPTAPSGNPAPSV